MARRLTIVELAIQCGMSTEELKAEFTDESIAMCSECSEDGGIEPDGTCPHGFPSMHIELGLI